LERRASFSQDNRLEARPVNISAKTEYACLAVIELAAHYGSGEPVRVNWIAEQHGIPARFLVQILLQLKSSGVVASTRGVAGGYQLVRDPSQMTLAEVMDVVEGQRCEVTSSTSASTAASQVLLSVWNEVRRVERSMLEKTTLADLAERVQGETEQMYFI
jgi:Rrf2 family protein